MTTTKETYSTEIINRITILEILVGYILDIMQKNTMNLLA